MQYYKRMAWIVELLNAHVRDELEALPADRKRAFDESLNSSRIMASIKYVSRM